MKAKLTVTCNNQTKAYALPEQGVKIGRDPGQCQLALQDPDVSSLHAFMCCKNGAWMLQDLGSTNGTYVNGNKITTVGLKSGDRIKFGVSVSAKIEIEEPKKEVVAPPKPATPPPPPQKSAIKVDNTPPPEMSADDVELIKLLNEKFALAKENLSQVVIGQMDVIELVLTAIFARGHVLLMGVPGLAKTLLIATLSQVLDLKFKRVQFTPDLMPSDITGTDVLEEDKESGGRKFRFVEGPVFTNMLLADEINRTPPKTQAALLEAMQEHHITVGTKTYNLPEPFFVMATQNPIEQEGTYPLPEAQMDRFLFNIIVKYPSAADEETIIRNVTSNRKVKLEKVLDGETVQKLQDVVKRVPVAPHVIQYAATLARMSRPKEPDVPDFVKELVGWGAGPRAGISLITAAKAWAILHGRHHCTMKDVEAIAMPVLRHRVITTFAAEAAGVTSDDLVNMLLKELKPTLDLEI
ncbi:MAG: AAA family ATPase [Kiritimatiellae bacterium]|nr:AAA family ATPase [Kiritimatiellia bacterium]